MEILVVQLILALFAPTILCGNQTKKDELLNPILFDFVKVRFGILLNATLSEPQKIKTRKNMIERNTDQTKVKRAYDDKHCLKDLHRIWNGLNLSELWALEMLDSWGNLPSTILSGNTHELGSIEECLNIDKIQEQKKGFNKILPQYCLSRIEKKPTNTTYGKNVTIGICIPASCSPSLIAATWKKYFVKSKYSIAIQNNECQLNNDYNRLTKTNIAIIILFGAVFCWVVVCTICDIVSREKKNQKIKNQTMLAFSARNNAEKIFSSNQTTDDIGCLHGIRAISTAWIVLYNLFPVIDEYGNQSVQNIGEQKIVVSYHRSIIQAGSIAVDSLFVMSGILVATSILKRLEISGKLKVSSIYFHRYLRLTPLLAASILFTFTVVHYFGSGPLWPSKVDFRRENCEKNWWVTLLYVQNYVNREHACISYGWPLAVDMQLFLFAPLLVPILRANDKRLILISAFLMATFVGLSITSYYILHEGYYTTYIATHLRFFPWVIGLILGCVLFDFRNKKVHIPRIWNSIGWIGSLILMHIYFYSHFPFFQSEFFHPQNNAITRSALYESLGRMSWSLGLCYIIFACVQNCGGPVNWLLSHSMWQPFSKLSYAINLFHMFGIWLIFFTRKTYTLSSEVNLFTSFLKVYSLSSFIAFIACLLIELPIAALEKMLMGKPEMKKTAPPSEDEQPKQ